MNKLRGFTTKNQRKISWCLTGLSCIGVVVTAVSSYKAAYKLDELRENCRRDSNSTPKDYARQALPIYAKPMIFGTATIACMIGCNIMNMNQQASMASAYALLQNYFNDYRSVTKELFSEEVDGVYIDADEKVRDYITIHKAETMYISSSTFGQSSSIALIDENAKEYLFCEENSQIYFTSTLERVMNAEYHFNRNFVLRGYAYLEEFLEMLGLDATLGSDVIGWAVEDECYWIDFDHRKKTLDDGREIIIITSLWAPSQELNDYMYF